MAKNKKLKNILSAEYHNKPIKTNCIVSGKSVAGYCIPRKIAIKCYPEEGQACERCPVKGKGELEIEAVDENVLKLIDVNYNQLTKIIGSIFGIHCKFSYENVSDQNVERIFIQPIVSKSRDRIDLASISYYVGYGLEVNTTYDMVGYTTVDPKNQSTVHVFTEARKAKSDVESFVMTPEKHKSLCDFQVPIKDAGDAFDYLEDKLYNYYAHNITKIYGRFDLHMAIDLAFRSVLSFKFDNEYIHKGWTDIMIIGDTRCGKGYVAEKLSKYFGLGEVISADNASFSGLVGGMQQFNGHWVITWGKIPLNDGGLIIIDEASELKPDDWTRLSRIRSEGVAEVTKIHAQTTSARTRLIFISNPILKTISNYSYGIQSVPEIVKAPEDIARFDYALVVAHDEVSVEDINVSHQLLESMYTAQQEQDLLLWTWSRKSNEIEFSSEAKELIYKVSIRLSSEYVFDIPLIQGENIRVKIARISISFASRFYSNKKDGKILFVDTIHVECAQAFLYAIYNKACSGYKAFSDAKQAIDLNSFEKYAKAYTLKQALLYQCLSADQKINIDSISEHINVEKTIAREIISKLLQTGCITKIGGTKYVKTPQFNE